MSIGGDIQELIGDGKGIKVGSCRSSAILIGLFTGALLGTSSSGQANIYDMGGFLSEPHPFANRTEPRPTPRYERESPTQPVQARPRDHDARTTPVPYEPSVRRRPVRQPSPGSSSIQASKPEKQLGQSTRHTQPEHRTKAGKWYISTNIGLHIPNDHEWLETKGGNQGSGDVWADESIVLMAAVGYKMGPLRVESEFSYRFHDLKHANVNKANNSGIFTSTGQKTLAADVETFAVMTNLWYERKMGSKWRPFVGGGLGFATHYVDIRKIAGVTQNFYGGDQVFAYQLGAGIGYQMLPHAMISVSYRYFATDEAIVEDKGTKYEANYYSNNLMAGLTFNF